MLIGSGRYVEAERFLNFPPFLASNLFILQQKMSNNNVKMYQSKT